MAPATPAVNAPTKVALPAATAHQGNFCLKLAITFSELQFSAKVSYFNRLKNIFDSMVILALRQVLE